MKVNYFQLPQVFGDDVQKLTTYLSSGYTGLDVLWLDDFMTGTFSNAGWLASLEKVVPQADFSAIAPAQLKLSTYNGHTYRLPANYGNVVFFYRKDLFDKEGISASTTWDEIFFPLIFSRSDASATLTLGITQAAVNPQYQTVAWGNEAAMGLIVIAPVFILTLIFQKQIVEGLMAGSLKG